MTKQVCEINESSWFCYKEICYNARSHERKKKLSYVVLLFFVKNLLGLIKYAFHFSLSLSNITQNVTLSSL